MDVRELEKLAIWYNDHFGRLSKRYQALIAPIQNNATQPTKLPFNDEMKALLAYLIGMDFEVLSLQQISMLEKIGVFPYIGIDGARFVETTIKTSNYDPATALSELNEGYNELNNTKSHFDTYIQALNGLKLSTIDDDQQDEYITVRVGFQNEASIRNMTEWKNSAKDWYDIIRGLALASNEAPERTRVVGASNGSIILTLMASAAVTTLLARISKHVTGVAKDGLEIANSVEDLRQKKILTKTMEVEFQTLVNTRKTTALETIIKEITPLLADQSGDKIPAIEGSIKKLLSFNEKGGAVDFVAPEEDAEEGEVQDPVEGDEMEGNEEVVPNPERALLIAARDAIRDYQEMREQLKLISYHQPKAE